MCKAICFYVSAGEEELTTNDIACNIVDNTSTIIDQPVIANMGEYSSPPKRFRKKPLPDSVMSSNDRLRQCAELIDQILDRKLEQESLDNMYDEMVNM